MRAFVVILLLLAGCARDLELPGRRAAPVVRAMVPDRGYADDVIAIEGDGFDDLAGNNQVFFQGQTTAAQGFDAQGRLLVKVPYDITSDGPIIVSTPAGKSEPFGKFIRFGYGHPTLGVAVGAAQVRHQPPGLAAAGGDLFVPSQYFRLLLSRSGAQVRLPGKPIAFAAAPGGATFFAALDDGTLRTMDRATGALDAGVATAFAVQALAATATGVYALGVAPDASLRAQGFGGVATAARKVPALSLKGAIAAQDGRHLVLAVDRDVSGTSTPAVLVVDMGDAASTPVALSPPGGRAATGALALVQVSGVDGVAVALDDGSVALLQGLDAAPAFSGAPIALVSQGRIGGLAAVQGLLLATKPQDGMAVIVDPAARAVTSAIPLRGTPTLAVADAATGHTFISDAASNGFDELDVVAGRWLGHFEFGTGLGATPDCDCAPAAAYPREDLGTEHHMFFLAPRLNQLVQLDSYSLALLPPVPLDTSASRALGVVGTPDGGVWVLHQGEIGVLSGSEEKLQIRGLAEAPAGLVATKDAVVVRSLHQLSVFKAGVRTGGFTVDDGKVVHLSLTAEGDVQAFWSRPSGAIEGARWTPALLASGGQPTARYTSAAGLLGYSGLLNLGAGPLLFFGACANVGSCIVQLDPALAAGAPKASPLDQAAPLLTSPDGRYFLWSRRTDKDGVLHLAAAAENADLVDFTSWQIPSDFAQPNFDPSGAWLYVPVPGLDEIRVLQ